MTIHGAGTFAYFPKNDIGSIRVTMSAARSALALPLQREKNIVAVAPHCKRALESFQNFFQQPMYIWFKVAKCFLHEKQVAFVLVLKVSVSSIRSARTVLD